MVLELRPPESTDLHALQDKIPVYWNNHHHLLQATRRVNGSILCANMYLLFWLSLFPFTTAWMGEHRLSARPAATYGVVSIFSAFAYYVLQSAVVREQGDDWPLAAALGRDVKGKISPLILAVGVGLPTSNQRRHSCGGSPGR